MILTSVLHELYTGHFFITWNYGTPLKFRYLLSLRLWCKALQQYVFCSSMLFGKWDEIEDEISISIFNFGYPLSDIRLVTSNPFNENLCKIYVWCSYLSALITSKSRDLVSNYGSSLPPLGLILWTVHDLSIFNIYFLLPFVKNIFLELGNSRQVFLLYLSFHFFTSWKAEPLPCLSCLLIEKLVSF